MCPHLPEIERAELAHLRLLPRLPLLLLPRPLFLTHLGLSRTLTIVTQGRTCCRLWAGHLEYKGL